MYEKCHVNDLQFLLRKHGGSYYIWLQHLNFFPNEGQLLSAGELPRAAWDHQLRTMDVCLPKTWQRLWSWNTTERPSWMPWYWNQAGSGSGSTRALLCDFDQIHFSISVFSFSK